jgi:hypothetical protein
LEGRGEIPKNPHKNNQKNPNQKQMGPLPGGPKFNPIQISTYAKPMYYTKRSDSAALVGWDAAQVCTARAAGRRWGGGPK